MQKHSTDTQTTQSRTVSTTRIVHTLHVDISDMIEKLGIQPEDHVEVVFQSRAMNREPSPVRLSYTTLARLTRDAI